MAGDSDSDPQTVFKPNFKFVLFSFRSSGSTILRNTHDQPSGYYEQPGKLHFTRQNHSHTKASDP